MPVRTPPGVARSYQLAFWPIGNEFKRGDRVRLMILGASVASLLGLPEINTVSLGRASGTRLLLPALPAEQRALRPRPARRRHGKHAR
jgi:hypothetical protein